MAVRAPLRRGPQISRVEASKEMGANWRKVSPEKLT